MKLTSCAKKLLVLIEYPCPTFADSGIKKQSCLVSSTLLPTQHLYTVSTPNDISLLRVSHIILTTVWCKLVPFSIECISLYILKYLMRVLIFFFLTCLDDNCKKKKNWQARWLKGVMTAIALCYSYVQLIWNKSTYFLWSRFGRLAITKWLANITDATGILQRHKEHIDDSF